MRTAFIRMLLVVFAIFAFVFAAEFAFEWNRLGRPGMGDLSWANTNNAKLVDVLSPMARAYNNILAMLLATIGLAIPLTANMHTPKLIDMFLRDKLNQGVLIVMALGAANVLFVDWIVGPKFAPLIAIRIAVYGGLAGWALLIPYFFYVVRFLDPSNILARLKHETTEAIDRAAAGHLDFEIAQDVIHERLYQIGTIVLKSLDRADRGVAIEGIWSLKLILDHYGALKSGMKPGWFVVDRKDFVGFSQEAIDLLNTEKTWLEMKVHTQLFLAYQAAMAKTSDVVSSISDANRVVAVAAANRGDDKATALAVRYFNNFVREAIKRKDVHSVYDVFYQYRLLARDLRERADVLRDIAHYIRYYAELGQASGMGFVAQLAAVDVGYIVRRAYEVKSTVAKHVLEQALGIVHYRGAEALPMVVKAKLVLGAFFLENGLQDEAELVRHNLADVSPAILTKCAQEMLSAEQMFWEVTDRQVNLEWVAPERREHVRRFVGLAEAAPEAVT
jgi:hypothetical protein